jgi:hypothetical protein
MRQVAVRLRIVLAILIATVGAGRGLPGIVEALLGPPAHVCTCVAGGEHATCPVCNPAIAERHQSRAPVARGLPCGDTRVAVGAPGEASTLPAPLLGLVRAVTRTAAPRAERNLLEQVIPEPATPPPRLVVT